MSNLALLEKKLKESGQSYTKSRQMVFAALEGQEPLAMSELVTRVDTSVNRASVYRTVKLFEELGIIHKLQIGWKYKLELSDDFHDHHHHIACIKCGHVTPINEDPKLETAIIKLAHKNQFSLLTHQLELRGICDKCQKS
jgi:Fur family ferric uptake transcriptional regulator